MPKLRQTAEILKLMDKKEAIRNIGIIAHIDHGKTTMTDSLLAKAGLIPPQIAGKARALDYLEEEQKRGITIKTANISLLHKMDGCQYVINLVDTPGHVDFTGKVTRALRAVDGAVVVVDAVEEVMAQTETVTRQALEERVKPTLFINKVDRLIKELKLNSDEIQEKFTRIIGNFNNLIEIYGEPQFKDEWKVSPEEETVAFGSALHGWGFTLRTAQQKGIKFSDIIKAYAKGKHENLAQTLPLHNAILDMVVKNVPNPIEAQKNRLPKIWRGETESEIGRAMQNCKDDGPTVICVTMAQVNSQEGVIVTGRVFSGSIKEGDTVYLLNAEKAQSVKQVSVYMGAFREPAEKISAGNIAALAGLDLARAGETLVSPLYRHVMVPFEPIKYVSEPVITVTVEPKNPNDLPRLIDAMNRLSVEDPNLVATVNVETGEYLLCGMGELHLEIALKSLKEYSGGIEIITPHPTVVYRESITARGIIAKAKSPNKQNMVWVQVEPLEEKALNAIEEGDLRESSEPSRVSEIFRRKTTLPIEEAENILALEKHRNILINLTRKTRFHEEEKLLISGFRRACQTGPLCGEPLRGVKVKLMEIQLSEDPTRCDASQIVAATQKAIFGSFLTAKPVLLEPVYKIDVSVPTQWVGECLNILARRRGKIIGSECKGVLTVIVGYIPVAETFGLAEELRSATSGYAFWQCAFHHWAQTPENIAQEIIRQIRERKGLPPQIPKPERFIEKA